MAAGVRDSLPARPAHADHAPGRHHPSVRPSRRRSDLEGEQLVSDGRLFFLVTYILLLGWRCTRAVRTADDPVRVDVETGLWRRRSAWFCASRGAGDCFGLGAWAAFATHAIAIAAEPGGSHAAEINFHVPVHPETDSADVKIYRCRCAKGMTVLDGLHYIKDNLDASLAWRYSCRMGICGSCACC